MRDVKTRLSKIRVLKAVLVFQVLGFIGVILSCWLSELFDPPFNWRQVLIETVAIVIVGSLTIYSTRQFIKRIQYLEGFMVICASCKRVREAEDKWVNVEQIISSKSELEFSHGICPECAKKLYGEYL
jgi:uncharacterized membrane protein